MKNQPIGTHITVFVSINSMVSFTNSNYATFLKLNIDRMHHYFRWPIAQDNQFDVQILVFSLACNLGIKPDWMVCARKQYTSVAIIDSPSVQHSFPWESSRVTAQASENRRCRPLVTLRDYYKNLNEIELKQCEKLCW